MVADRVEVRAVVAVSAMWKTWFADDDDTLLSEADKKVVSHEMCVREKFLRARAQTVRCTFYSKPVDNRGRTLRLHGTMWGYFVLRTSMQLPTCAALLLTAKGVDDVAHPLQNVGPVKTRAGWTDGALLVLTEIFVYCWGSWRPCVVVSRD